MDRFGGYDGRHDPDPAALRPAGRASRILDMSTVVAGPFAASLLADLGADVIKVEMPGKGDPLRALAPHKNDVPLWWKVTNRNKKGITLDLRQPDGATLLRLTRRRRRAGREFSPRHARRLGHHAGLAAGHQPPADHPARHRLRPDRPVSRPAGLCPHLRGDERLYADLRRRGRHAAASRLSDLRCDRRIVRRAGRAVGAATMLQAGSRRSAARRSTAR